MTNRFRILSVVILALVAFAGGGCGNSDLPSFYLLDHLRVVAATTTGASDEFNAGDSATVNFHVSDPTGAGRTLTTTITACVDPGVGEGATPSCTGNPTANVLTASGSFTPGSAATNYYGVLTTPAVTIPAANVIFVNPLTGGTVPSYTQANGVAYLVVLTLTAANGDTTSAFKRLIVSTKATKNQNPTFGSPAVLFNGGDATSYILTTDAFSYVVQAAAGAAETYSITGAGGTVSTATEQLTVTYLVTSGAMTFTRSDPAFSNTYTPANPLPAETTFIAVLRDDRGGEAVFSVSKP